VGTLKGVKVPVVKVRRSMNATKLRVAAAALAVLFAFAAASATAEAQPVPDVTAPPGVTTVREVQGGGAQIYACHMTASDAYQWTLTGPKAILINADGSDFGTHGFGPAWTATDGSSIGADGAHPLAKADRAGSVPSLLLTVTSSRGSGVLNGIRLVRRSDTKGGLPPASGCDAGHLNATAASHYSAVYTFYR
jgi:hypothetical protein